MAQMDESFSSLCDLSVFTLSVVCMCVCVFGKNILKNHYWWNQSGGSASKISSLSI